MLSISPSRADNAVVLSIHSDGLGDISLTLPTADRPTDVELRLFAELTAIIYGQIEMEPVLHVHAAEPSEDRRRFVQKLAKIIYDANAYTTDRDAVRPVIRYAENYSPLQAPAQKVLNGQARRAWLMWSGGKDSLAALNVLRGNGFVVKALHANANVAVEQREQTCAEALARRSKLDLVVIHSEWHELVKLYSRTSPVQFPLANPVPHGRDLLIAAMCSTWAVREGSPFVCAGYERDLWTKRVTNRAGEQIWRHDAQSSRAGSILSAILREDLGLRFFSPISAISEYRLLRWMFTRQEWEGIASCFWETWCGECSKCFRYGLVERSLGVSQIPFACDPLTEGNPALQRLNANILNRDLPYWEELVLASAVCVEMGALPGSHPLSRAIESASSLLPRDFAVRTKRRLLRCSGERPPVEGFSWRLPP